MNSLDVVFGGKNRVRIIRLFLLNPDRIYDTLSIEKLCGVRRREIERELPGFERIGLVKRKRYFRDEKRKRIPISGWMLDNSFMYLLPLRSMFAESVIVRGQEMVRRLRRGGALKLVILAGIFVQNWESRIDLLIVGDKLRKRSIERILRSMEREIGRELHYALLSSADFQYRMSVGDKLVRDVFDFPYQIAVNRSVLAK